MEVTTLYIPNPKKMNIILILDILKKFSDENHKLTQSEIASIIKREYEVSIDRHTLKRNLDNLLDYNCGVEYAKRYKESDEPGGWYFERDLTDAEVRMLIDGLVFSKYIPYSECKGLIKKLEKLSSVHFKSSYALPENRPENKEIFLNIEELLRAMSAGKKVSFNYLRYGTDKKPSIALDKNGKPRVYIVSPYEIVITNGHYYLICAPERKDTLYHYRLNAICNIEVLKTEKRRPIRSISGFKNGLNLAEYMKELPYMMSSGESVRATFRFNKWAIGHVFEWFGKDIHLMDETEKTITAIVKVNEKAMLYWALQYGKHVEVLEPLSLRTKIREAIAEMSERYK